MNRILWILVIGNYFFLLVCMAESNAIRSSIERREEDMIKLMANRVEMHTDGIADMLQSLQDAHVNFPSHRHKRFSGDVYYK